MKKYTLLVTSAILALTSLYAHPIIPIDSNVELGNENDILYYVDPRPEEGGENRALRIDTKQMVYQEIAVDGINPHSIDRAGNTDKFYIRTQNSFSFDVVNFKNDTVKTISLGDHKPRALGGYNNKYKIQLLSSLNMPIADVIDTRNDEIITTVGDRHNFNPNNIHSNGGGAATGHSIWLTKRYFVLIDRVHAQLKLYKVFKRRGRFYTVHIQTLTFPSAIHAIERVNSQSGTLTFYALGEGDVGRVSPFIAELKLQKQRGRHGKLSHKIRYLSESNNVHNGIKPTTHHAGVTPDKKYLIVPVYDGKIYVIKRQDLSIYKVIETGKLGAGHIEFSASRNLAIITNHYDKDITILDLRRLVVKKYLTISHHNFDPNSKHLLQPHFSHVDKNGKYFYTFATQDGNFLKIDLDRLEIVDTLHTGGTPEQAHS